MQFSFAKEIVGVFLLGLLFTACSTPQLVVEDVSLPTDLKINQLQVLGTHNSYAQPVDTAVLNYIDPIFEKMMGQYFANQPETIKAKYKEYHPNEVKMSEGLAYNHPDFEAQLNAGMRSLEIDVYHDPTGNRFNRPAAYEVLKQMGKTDLLPFDSTGLDKPGFKVLHMADIDFRTHYTTFEKALLALKDWSNAHPQHSPIFIMIEAKDSGIPVFRVRLKYCLLQSRLSVNWMKRFYLCWEGRK
ncbi:Ca2+-dependent phosphoinositide-specific phospholipase C [Rapidithrix thailandica]|uniref:Ca2+-dependent phosphoinositide-specific phospholipase C n=1 Tax=Rapidithrix thailandica TaxID=413964 RepID=A0AAW9SJT0_9BACT